MDEENQHEQEAFVRMPLHPRKAQELFNELLQVAPSIDVTTDALHAPTSRSFQQRVAYTQQFCTDAVKLLQRGQWIRTASKDRSDPLVLLRFSPTGTNLELHAFAPTHEKKTQDETIECVESLALASIRTIELLPDAWFMIHSSMEETNEDDNVISSLFHTQLEAESEQVLVRIAVAVAGSVSVHRENSSKHCTSLLFQAIRLRLVELSIMGVPLQDAVLTMEAAYEDITTRETLSELPSIDDLFLLRAR